MSTNADKPKTNRGGARPGAGRPARGAARSDYKFQVRLSPDEHATLIAGIRTDEEGKQLETLTDMLREGGLALARRRLGQE